MQHQYIKLRVSCIYHGKIISEICRKQRTRMVASRKLPYESHRGLLNSRRWPRGIIDDSWAMPYSALTLTDRSNYSSLLSEWHLL